MRARIQRLLRLAGSTQECGYTLVVLAVAVSVMTVLVAAALPHWSHVVKREKEEELIFRGWQYAEAIRVFTQRTGRYPTNLKELMEVKPRSIRRLWKDPVTENGNWALVVQGLGPGQGNPNVRPGGNPNGGSGGIGPGSGGNFGGGIQGDGDDPGSPGSGSGNPNGESNPNGGAAVGPITGVRSRSKDEATKTLFGKEKYSDWEFTVEALVSGGRSGLGGAPVPPGGGRPGGPAQNPNPLPGFSGATTHPQLPKTQWIGRPFREGLDPAGGSTPPGGPQNGGVPGTGGAFGGTKPSDSPPPVGDDDN